MNSNTTRPITAIFLEALVVALIGGVLALTANALSPRGLSLVKNYFPVDDRDSGPQLRPSPPAIGGMATNDFSPAQMLADQIRKAGFQVMEGNQAAQLFRSADFRQNRVVFVDARDEEHYQQGHVPGAYELDPYHLEKYLAEVLPVCQAAGQIVVYCNGGECEDSQSAATTLRNAGIPAEKLFVFVGGISDWQASRLPVETGERNSGRIRNGGE